jgi:hypothetical protein
MKMKVFFSLIILFVMVCTAARQQKPVKKELQEIKIESIKAPKLLEPSKELLAELKSLESNCKQLKSIRKSRKDSVYLSLNKRHGQE